MFDITKLFQAIVVIQLLCIKLSLASNDTSCAALKSIFAKHASKFTSCAIDNSRPITLCESCVDLYIKVEESYANMTKLSIDNTTRRCIDNYINLDRLQIIETIYRNSIDLWNRAKCYECFQMDDGILTPNKSIETITFDEYYNTFSNCINKTYDNNTIMCSTCLPSYTTLDIYYNGISNENEKIGVCMDMVDLMNNTRTFFSAKCCNYRRHNEYVYIGCSAVIMLITILFYVLTQKCSVERIPAILQQTRFAESLNHLNQ